MMDDQNGQQNAHRRVSVAEIRSMWEENANSSVPKVRQYIF